MMFDLRKSVDTSPARISAAMIVRNEEMFIDACLKSILNEVDEIVVVDTGSNDRTREIAARYKLCLFNHPWTGDFAAARNYALDRASGDWILYIDADERLIVPEPGALRKLVQQQDVVAFSVRFQPGMHFTSYQEIRLFRRDPRIRFQGIIHETVRPNLEAVMQSDCKTFAASNVRINHIGYEGDMISKYRRNLPLLEEAVKVAPGRVFLWADMAEALAGLSREKEAKEACLQAIELAAASQDPKQKFDCVLAWRRLIALSGEDPDDAVRLGHRAVALHPNSYSLWLDLARALFTAGEVEKVLPIVQTLIAIDAETFFDPITAYDKRIFGEWAFDLMGAAHARLGHREAAAEAFGRAAQLAPDNVAYRVKTVALSAPKAS